MSPSRNDKSPGAGAPRLAAVAQYRADWHNAKAHPAADLLFDGLATAQQRCEEELRAARDGDRDLEFRWELDQDTSTVRWTMKVRTRRLGRYVRVGYWAVLNEQAPGGHESSAAEGESVRRCPEQDAARGQ